MPRGKKAAPRRVGKAKEEAKVVEPPSLDSLPTSAEPAPTKVRKLSEDEIKVSPSQFVQENTKEFDS
jgi:calcium-dependent protein kinase